MFCSQVILEVIMSKKKIKDIDPSTILGVDPVTLEVDPKLFDQKNWSLVKPTKQFHKKGKQKQTR